MKKLISILFAILLATPLNAQVNRSKPPEPGPPPEINLVNMKNLNSRMD